jgi:hypothetical protein
MSFINIRKAIIISVICVVSVFGVALAYNDSVIVNSYQIDFLGVEELPDGHSTIWTYAITEPTSTSKGNGMSHWTLGIGNCGYQIVAPPDMSVYRTPDGLEECNQYNCQSAEYEVEHGPDGILPALSGIKFSFEDDPSLQLQGGDPQHTHIFQFELYYPNGGYREGDTDILVKTGNGYELGTIHGPVCKPTAVNLTSFEASSRFTPFSKVIILFVLGLFLLFAGPPSIAYARRVIF